MADLPVPMPLTEEVREQFRYVLPRDIDPKFFTSIEKIIGDYGMNVTLDDNTPGIAEIRAAISTFNKEVMSVEQHLLLLREGTGSLIHDVLSEDGHDSHAFIQEIRSKLKILRQATVRAELTAQKQSNKISESSNSARRILVYDFAVIFKDFISNPTSTKDGTFDQCVRIVFDAAVVEKKIKDPHTLICTVLKSLKSSR